MDATRDARCLIESFTSNAEPAARRMALSQWELATRATEAAEAAAEAAHLALGTLYADDAVHAEAKRLQACDIGDPLLAREAKLLYLATLSYRRDPETLARMVKLETELESMYSTYRGVIDGARQSDNEIRQILHGETNHERRRAAWEASKGIGSQVAPTLLELARLRNEVARKVGFRDWFAMALATDEIDEAWLFGLLDHLEQSTRAPFDAEKRAIDDEAAGWLGLSASELMPWHYQDVFFQEAPTTSATSLDPLIEGRDVVRITRSFYEDLGFGAEIDAILAKSDLFPREKKSEHAFCTHIDRSGDVRVLCNVVPTERWLDTMLHELGHGIYDFDIDRSLPWGLRAPAHIFATEAIAMLMGRRSRDPEFLRRYLEPRTPEEERIDRAHMRRRMLLFVRWVLVMTNFERELYREPVRDAATLGAIWWDLVEKYQRVRRPPGLRSFDWATKIHVALAPVYYQNYLLGELTASQIEHAVREGTGRPLTGNPDAARLLKEKYFAPGARMRWDALVEHATGSPLSVERFVRDFVET